jgi:hypothetical protein
MQHIILLHTSEKLNFHITHIRYLYDIDCPDLRFVPAVPHTLWFLFVLPYVYSWCGLHHGRWNNVIYCLFGRSHLNHTEKPSGQLLGLIVMSQWLNEVWIRIRDISVFTFIFVSFEESCLLVSWGIGGMDGMTDSDKDCCRNRRSGAEDRRWSHRLGTRWSDDREIGWCLVRSAPCT